MLKHTANGQDRRVKRTQTVLAKALIALSLEKGYEAVTIRDITARADVGYATFFRHYGNKAELLQDVLDVFLDELIALLQPQTHTTDPATVGTLLFRYVGEHSALCRVLLGSQGSAALLQRVREAGTRRALQQYSPLPNSAVPPEVAAHHIVASSIALIQWWLEHDMPYTLEHMGTIYHHLIVGPTQAVAFEHNDAASVATR